MNTAQFKAVAASYLRAAVAAVLALYLAGVTDPQSLLNAAIAAVAGPLLRALNPNDPSFGINADK